MKISEYLELQKTDNEIWRDINNYTRGFDMEKYGDMESLLLDVQKVITSYRTLVSNILDKIDIENGI